jgi:hypothetical protein
MAGLIIAATALPGIFMLTNVASLAEGKGLRLAGGVLDVALVTCSVFAAITAQERVNKRSLNTESVYEVALVAAGTGVTYATIKHIIGSPTSTTNNFVIGGAIIALPMLLHKVGFF